MALPASFIEHVTHEGYHPRSNAHSNALAVAIATDLFKHCDELRARGEAGNVVYDLNFNIQARTSWNVDLVIGEPPPHETSAATGEFSRGHPSTIQIAIELKAVMTEHRKAVRNRVRDLEAHHQHVHQYNPRTVAGGVLLINASERFQSPLRRSPTEHRSVDALLLHCVQELRGVDVRAQTTLQGLDAACAMVIDFSNTGDTARYFTGSPAPLIGDPLHYDAFIQRICGAYEQLWS